MDSLKKQLLDLLDENDIPELFEELKKLKLNDHTYKNLQEEFIHGAKYDFAKRIKTHINYKFDELVEKEEASFGKANNIEALQVHIAQFAPYQGQSIGTAKEKLQNLLHQQKLQKSWENAQKQDQIEGYQYFIANFEPETALVTQAKQKIARLEEEALWQKSTKSIEQLLDKYTHTYPQGVYVAQAQAIAKQLNLAYQAENEPKAIAQNPFIIPLSNKISIAMIPVEGGTFGMGYKTRRDGEDDGYLKDAKPFHLVTLDSFYMGKFTVTQEQYFAVMDKDSGSYFKGDRLPVEMISWDETQEFINKLNAKTGKTFRLPTEAEWEFAARGGQQSRRFMYAGSNNLDEVAWYDDENSGSTTHEVGSKDPNELGVYDLSGNVWEWCEDYYDAEFYEKSAGAKNPVNKIKSGDCVTRGGGWRNLSASCRAAFRACGSPTSWDDDLGFRLVLSL